VFGSNSFERVLGGLILNRAEQTNDDGGMFKRVISIECIVATKLLLLSGRQSFIEPQLALHPHSDLGLWVLLHIEHARIDLHSALGRAIVLKLQQKAVIVNSLD